MRQAGTDLKGLVATGNWRDERTASRYAHAVARDEWERVNELPSLGKTRGVASWQKMVTNQALGVFYPENRFPPRIKSRASFFRIML
jgi:hypothetical protein